MREPQTWSKKYKFVRLVDHLGLTASTASAMEGRRVVVDIEQSPRIDLAYGGPDYVAVLEKIMLFGMGLFIGSGVLLGLILAFGEAVVAFLALFGFLVMGVTTPLLKLLDGAPD